MLDTLTISNTTPKKTIARTCSRSKTRPRLKKNCRQKKAPLGNFMYTYMLWGDFFWGCYFFFPLCFCLVISVSLLLCFSAFLPFPASLLLRCSASLIFAFLLFFLSLLLCFFAFLLLCLTASSLFCFSAVLRFFCFSSLYKPQDVQYKYTISQPQIIPKPIPAKLKQL